MSKKDLSFEIVKAVEVGINFHLRRSLAYSPFRIFYKFFKKSRPNTMEKIRQQVRIDVKSILKDIEDFKENLFIQDNQMTQEGKDLLNIAYNTGINLLKKELNTIKAFKLMKNTIMQEMAYEYVLVSIKLATENITKSAYNK